MSSVAVVVIISTVAAIHSCLADVGADYSCALMVERKRNRPSYSARGTCHSVDLSQFGTSSSV